MSATYRRQNPRCFSFGRQPIGGLRWSEIDTRYGVINLPSERTKNGHAHFVPLSEPVRAGAYNRANYHSERKQALEKIMALVTKPKGVARTGARPGVRPLKDAVIPSH